MKVFLQTGIQNDCIPHPDKTTLFFIEDLETPYGSDNYYYPKSELNYELDSVLVNLYDTFIDSFFKDIDKYYSESMYLPTFIVSAGYNSDFPLPVDEFNKQIVNPMFKSLPNVYKHLYLQDCQAMISTIQNLLSGMEYSFINYYKMISEIDYKPYHPNEDNIVWHASTKVIAISSLLENYFIKAHSIMDMICKILFELQNVQEDFTRYKKLKSSKKLWGDRKHLDLSFFEDTVFNECLTIQMIESLRNEVVHNGSWEQHPKVFIKIENGQVVEKFMLFPDILHGRLACSKNRRHFFSMGTKVNDIFPRIHSEFKERLIKTVKDINEKYTG